MEIQKIKKGKLIEVYLKIKHSFKFGCIDSLLKENYLSSDDAEIILKQNIIDIIADDEQAKGLFNEVIKIDKAFNATMLLPNQGMKVIDGCEIMYIIKQEHDKMLYIYRDGKCVTYGYNQYAEKEHRGEKLEIGTKVEITLT